MSAPVVLLHGFAGTGRGWDAVAGRLERYTAQAPDLRGHGSAAGLRPISFGAVTADVLAAAPPSFTLCGYSMGGRIALHVALAAPDRVRRLVLVATTAGIEDAAERAARREADAALAGQLEAGTVEAFAGRWLAQPLFAGDAPEVQAAARADIERNTPAALAEALRGLGTGVMAPLWDRLGDLPMPALALVGERDAKFRALGERLAGALPDARLETVAGAGHALPREAPAAVAAAIDAA